MAYKTLALLCRNFDRINRIFPSPFTLPEQLLQVQAYLLI